MPYALLALAQLAGLFLVPFGLPGTWIQVAALGIYGWSTGFATIGWPSVLFAIALAAVGEVIEFTLGGRYARKYGGSRRAGWGAILGGLAGALLGFPIPIVGSVIGAFVGAFAGAAIMQLTLTKDWRNPELGSAVRVGWGAFIGRLVATAAKSAVAVAIAALALVSALR